MKKTVYFAIDYYDRQTISRIMEKYGMDPMDATRRFLLSETHAMLEDPECGMMCLPDDAVFDMWEAEQVTGDPRDSIYVRGE